MYKFHHCQNGICIQYERKNSVTAYLSYAYLAGLKDDSTGTMLAHIAEHIVYSVLKDIIANSSGQRDLLHFLNAYTNWNTTVFWMRPINTPSLILYVIKCFAQLSEYVANNLMVDEELFAKERITVENEMLCKSKKSLQQETFSAIYGLKSKEIKLTDTLVSDFIKNNYKGIVITIVGSISLTEWNYIIDFLEGIHLPKCNKKKIQSKNKIVKGNLKSGYAFNAVQLFETVSLKDTLYLQMLATMHSQIAKKYSYDKKIFYYHMNGHVLLYRITYSSQKCREYQMELSENFYVQYFQSFMHLLCLELDNPENIAMWHLRNQYSFGHSFSTEKIIKEYESFDYNHCVNIESTYRIVFEE